jgi:hypothetical protein
MSDALVSVAITARGSDSLPLEEATSELTLDFSPTPMVATGYRPTFAVPQGTLGTGGSMTVTCPGYTTRTARVIMPVDPGLGIRVANAASDQQQTAEGAYAVMDQEFICQVFVEHPIPPPTGGPLLPLVVDGKWFRTSDGETWTQIACSDFRLFDRYIRGEDIHPILAERREIGFNMLRVFGMCGNMFQLRPQEYGERYWSSLVPFIELCGSYGFYVEWTAFVDATVVMPDKNEQLAFWDRLCRELTGLVNLVCEAINEAEQSINYLASLQELRQPAGLISSHGSKGVVDAAREAVCVEPLWSYGTLHPGRPEDWPRLQGHNTMEDVADKFGKPGTCNESCRPDQGRGPIPSDWFDGAANAALLCAGATMHSQCGKDSRLFDPTERACAEAWVKGAKAVPLDYQRGAYIAGHLSGYPINWAPGDSARAHGRLIADHACLSLPQMREGFVPTARPGWTITRVEGSVVELIGTARATKTLLDEVDLDARRRVH